jgi:hypothetical protein
VRAAVVQGRRALAANAAVLRPVAGEADEGVGLEDMLADAALLHDLIGDALNRVLAVVGLVEEDDLDVVGTEARITHHRQRRGRAPHRGLGRAIDLGIALEVDGVILAEPEVDEARAAALVLDLKLGVDLGNRGVDALGLAAARLAVEPRRLVEADDVQLHDLLDLGDRNGVHVLLLLLGSS